MRFIFWHKSIYITLMAGNLACLFALGQEDLIREPKIGIPITLVFLAIHIHNFFRITKKAPYNKLVLEEFLTAVRMFGPILYMSGYGIHILLFFSPVSCTWWWPLLKLFSFNKNQFILVFFIFPTLLIIIEYIYLTKLKILRNS